MTDISPELQFIKTFDSLIESRSSDLTFVNEARSVSDFTRLYIQVLFGLSDDEFRQIMKAHSALHAKAQRFEQRGRNPLELLQQQIASKDLLGRLLEKHLNHLGALDCILDARATAALVHHLIRMPLAESLQEKVVGCEFGAGMGILSIAGSILFAATERTISLYAFEQAPESLDHARKIADILRSGSRYGHFLQFDFVKSDISTDEPYRFMAEEVSSKGELGLWISETFGYQSRSPVVSPDGENLSFSKPHGVVPYPLHLETVYDPFPKVLNLSCEYFDSFLKKIKTGNIVAFPDIVTPRVTINGTRSALLSADGTWRKLNMIGEPYSMLPHSAGTRWAFVEKSKPSVKKKKLSLRRRKKVTRR